MFNTVAPYRYLLPNLYLSVADIANPDMFVCGSRTWISLDIACRLCRLEAISLVYPICHVVAVHVEGWIHIHSQYPRAALKW